MPLDWTPFVNLIHSHECFLLTTHIRPDGDGLGSMFALADTLERLGKRVHTVVASALVPRYDFLDPRKRLQRFTLPGTAYRDTQAVIVLDTGTWNQLGEFGTFLKTLDVPKLVIDHHITQDDLGGVALVDTTAEATGRLAWEAINALNEKPSPEAAHALFVAVAMDTGWFRHSNTLPATFALASALEAAGARPTEAYEALFEQNSLGRLKLMGQMLSRITLACNGRVAYSEVQRSDYQSLGATPQDSEDLVNFTRSIIGVEVGLFFLEQPRGGVKVSFRSRERVDVSRIAQQFGGGGHRLASGAILETSLDEARSRVLAAVASALEPSL